MINRNLVILTLILGTTATTIAKTQKIIDCRLITPKTTQCKPYSTKFMVTKEITSYDISPQLIIQKTLPLPPKSSITIISVEDMIEKHIEVLEPIRYTTPKPEVVEIEGNLSQITPMIASGLSKKDIKKEQADKYPKYKIQKGDSLNLIAKRFDMSIKKLLKWNKFKDKSKIILGQKIIIPVMHQKFKLLNYKYKNRLRLAKKKLALAKKKLAKAKKKRAFKNKLYPSKRKQFKYAIDKSKFKRKLRVQATAYTSHRNQTDKTPFLAAWNNRLRPGMKSIAVSRDLIRKYGIGNGKRVKIRGLSGTYVVKDKMNKRFRKRIDIYMGLNRRKALRWGRRNVTIYW